MKRRDEPHALFPQSRPGKALILPKLADPLLPGLWHKVSGPFGPATWLIQDDGWLFTIDAAYPYAILNDNQLNYGPWELELVHGDGQSVFGVWRDPPSQETVFFRDDLTFSWHDPAGYDYFGTFRLTRNPDTIRLSNALGIMRIENAKLVVDVVFNQDYSYTYTVSQTTLDLTEDGSGFQFTFERIEEA